MLFGGKHLQQGDFAVLVSNYIVRPKDEKCTVCKTSYIMMLCIGYKKSGENESYLFEMNPDRFET